ncbi:MAG: aspartate carbamoyltransferase regulatory subunit [Bacteroidales bacterium]|nr:aspartate carbamoyltransferase regulatory subunit [Bacteroidales bacterium]MCF8338705.1 aspartate carbamoyltransferase regulatory subunit [Bacteroidales bacterium]
MDNKKELKVSAIENGTVIDHIPKDKVLRVVRILGLDESEDLALFGINLDSKKFRKKGLIKVSNKFFKDEEINKIGLVAPNASLITIKDFKVVEKRQVEMPEEIGGYVKCINPKCVTNHQNVYPQFKVYVREGEGIRLKCHYCEKTTKQSEMEFVG